MSLPLLSRWGRCSSDRNSDCPKSPGRSRPHTHLEATLPVPTAEQLAQPVPLSSPLSGEPNESPGSPMKAAGGAGGDYLP